MAYTPIPGKASTISVNSTSVQLRRCSARIRATIIDASAFGTTADSDSNYWAVTITGLCRATLTMSGSWETGAKPTASAGIGLRPGKVATTPTFTLASGVAFIVPGNVEEIDNSAEVDQDVQFSCTIQSTGAVTYPS